MDTPGPFRRELDASVAALSLQVTRDNLLQARAALLAEAARLDRLVKTCAQSGWIGVCGNDPVSPEAATAFNERIVGLLHQCIRYNDDLRAAAHALDATARGYGFTDDDIAGSFRPAG